MPRKFWEVSDEVWAHVEPWIPEEIEHRPGWRRRPQNNRKRLEALIFQMKTGCRWDALPEGFGDPLRLEALQRSWAEAGVFHILFFALLHQTSATPDVDLTWCVAEGVGSVLEDVADDEAVPGDEVPLAARGPWAGATPLGASLPS